MVVECLSNEVAILSPRFFMPKGIYNPRAEKDASLTPGKSYVVYAIMTLSGETYYYLCTDEYSEIRAPTYPQARPAQFFSVSSAEVSNTWRVVHSVHKDEAGQLLLAPAEWAVDTYFYDKLTDGDEAARGLWLSLKDEIDIESGYSKFGQLLLAAPESDRRHGIVPKGEG